jgi:hypothetical protein
MFKKVIAAAENTQIEPKKWKVKNVLYIIIASDFLLLVF